MSSAERFVRHHRRQTDRAISEAYACLAADSHARATFTVLLQCVRERSARLLRAPVIQGRHPGVEALFNLSRFAGAHVRSPSCWRGSRAAWRGAVSALAQHLLGHYTVPTFLGAAWYAMDDVYAEAKREWFVAHGAGARFRSLSLPIAMTSRMEHLFLGSRDHVGIEYAMRRAELLALGAHDQLVDAVLATRLGSDLEHSDFWRTLWIFLIANANAKAGANASANGGDASAYAGDVPLAQVGPLIDFLHAVRHDRVAIETSHGLVIREPPQPQFSLKGRTARSLLRLMAHWHRGLGLVAGGGLAWDRSRLRPMIVETPRQEPSAPPVQWEITELSNSAALRAEGVALQHCVARYSYRCWDGTSRIWSLRRMTGTRVRSILTIEVDPRARSIVQARGFRNQPASRTTLDLLQRWADRENLWLSL